MDEVEKVVPETGEERPETAAMAEKSVSRSFTGKFGKRKVAYTATAATQVVDQGDRGKAVFFHVAYTEDGADPTTRPLVFAWNGGPGSSTVWLHLGLLGPRRVEVDEEGFRVSSPGRLLDNEHSLLDVADLILVDAVGTGFSTAQPDDKEGGFHHFSRDVDAFADFVVSYLSRNGRWLSPRYLVGESYGTTRAAAVARRLLTEHEVELNGLVLVSTALNFQTIWQERDTRLFPPGNDLPYMVFLPSYAATAWYHGRLSRKLAGKSLRELLDEVEEFAIGPYWSALARGARLDPKERARILTRLSEYTGLDPGYLDRYDLRIHIHRFCKELLRERERTVGRLDSRYLGIDRVADGDYLDNDPASDEVSGVFASTLNHYLRQELGFEHEGFYETLSMKINESWDYEDFKGRFVDTSEPLREVMSRVRAMKVMVANGYYDLATPFFATEYTIDHLGLDPELRPNVRMEYYEAGHMMYLQRRSLARLAADLRRFVASTD